MGLLIGLLLVLVIRWYYTSRDLVTVRESVAEEGKQPFETIASSLTTMGKASCSGIACHGNAKLILVDPQVKEARWQSSYAHWESLDPHRNAYQSLETKWAKTILQQLSGTMQPLEHYKPETDQRCLACHTNPSLAVANPIGVEKQPLFLLRAEGVSCEACHGNASKWLNEHTAWSSLESRIRGYQQTNMVPLNEPGQRAMACAGCHVGSPEDSQRGFPVRDMNHDMIAAGHPRLFFEYTTFVKRLPPHWQEKNRGLPGSPSRSSDEKAYAWFAGQLATTEAFMRLSSDRARRAQSAVILPTKVAWPELAEFKCYACHQSVNGSATPPLRTRLELHPPGSLLWDLPLSSSLSKQLLSIQHAPGLFTALKEMQAGKIPHGESASTQILQTAELLRGYRNRLTKLPTAPWQKALLEWITTANTDQASWDWDEYATRYYALVYLLGTHDTLARLKPEVKAQLESKLAALADSLRFPANSKEVFAGPSRWERHNTGECYQAVIKVLKQIVPGE